MRAFQVLAVTLAATAARGQIISGYGSGIGGYGLGIGGLSYGASYAPSVSYGYGSLASPVSGYATTLRSPSIGYSTGSVISSAPAVQTISAAPAISVAAAPVVQVAAAPAVRVASAPAVSYGIGGGLGGLALGGGGGGIALGGGIGGGAIVTGSGGGGVRSHEIHTGGAGNTIRIEEIKAGGQVIRVHDSPRLGAEVLNVQGPAAAGNHIRLISRSGPTQVQRSVVQDPNVQVFDIVNPPQPGDRIINIRKAPAPPAQVELVADQHHGVPEIQVGGDEPNIQVQHLGGSSLSTAVLGASNVAGVSIGGSYGSYAAAPVATIAAAPIATRVATVSAAPVASYAVSAPAVQTISAAPAVSYSTGLRTISAPAIGGISYGSSLGGLSYGGLGGSTVSYGLGGSSLGYGLGGSSLGYGLGGNSYGATTILGKKAKKASA